MFFQPLKWKSGNSKSGVDSATDGIDDDEPVRQAAHEDAESRRLAQLLGFDVSLARGTFLEVAARFPDPPSLFDAVVTLPAISLFAENKRILGTMYGAAQVRRDFPRFVSLAETGRLDLGTMVSRRIHLHEVNDAFRAMEAGEVIRSVITDL